MSVPVAIPMPLPHIGSVNAWLLRGDPVTLIDTGPREDGALAALEAGAAAFLTKPCLPEDLEAAVRRLVPRPDRPTHRS